MLRLISPRGWPTAVAGVPAWREVPQRKLQFVVEALRHSVGGVHLLTHFRVIPADAHNHGHLKQGAKHVRQTSKLWEQISAKLLVPQNTLTKDRAISLLALVLSYDLHSYL